MAESVRDAGLKGNSRHMNTKGNCEKLDMVWARALAHAGLPLGIIEDEHIRDDILQASLAKAP